MSGKSIFPLPQDPFWIHRLLGWANQQYPFFAYFTNNNVPYPQDGFEHCFFTGREGFTLEEAESYYGKKEMVGIIAYDYKNRIENLKSSNSRLLDLPETVFFIPELEIRIGENEIIIRHGQSDEILKEILEFQFSKTENPAVAINSLTDQETYLSHIKAIQEHILEGDIYEMNYCMAFTFKDPNWNPLAGFWDLMEQSPMPFSSFFRSNHQYLICASPERFLKKSGNRLIAQPIKGTLKRGRGPEEDLYHKQILQQSEKEQAENLMIVDLMRNDLSRVSETGTISVEELFGVYPFPRVWQMISTVSSVAKNDLSLKELIHATFPMGSMTGAPKIKCMELIDQYENFQRGWFSGTLGYIDAQGNLDLNVIIRSIIFDQQSASGYLAVGSAITYDADAGYEYEECFLKASAILEILTKQ